MLETVEGIRPLGRMYCDVTDSSRSLFYSIPTRPARSIFEHQWRQDEHKIITIISYIISALRVIIACCSYVYRVC